MNIIVSLGVGMLIFIVDKRQSLDEIIQTQHKMTQEIHKILTEPCSDEERHSL